MSIVKDGDRLDELCVRIYGDLSCFEMFLEANPQLIGKWKLSADDVVNVPPKPPREASNEGALW